MRAPILFGSLLWAGVALAGRAPPALFGTPLLHVHRAPLEGALAKAGLTPMQVGKRFWFDIYQVHGQLPGASRLLVGYTQHNHFAVARHVFPSFMDPGQVRKIMAMVQDKYGPPTRRTGMVNLGAVTATWQEPYGMEIRVARGWPSTTTTLSLENVANHARMQEEIAAEKSRKIAAQTRADSGAF